jgi:large subunit ribosomal protein L11
MAKVVKANLKMRLPGGRASAGPPVGSILGQHGLNLMDFVQAFNDQTKDLNGKDVIVHVRVYEDRTFDFDIIGQPVDDLIREAAKLEKGSGKPHVDKVGKITKSQVREIAEKKMGVLNANDTEAAMKIIAGTARSMGVEVVEG